MAVTPFTIDVDDLLIDDLRDRLRGTRWPDQLEGMGWDRGTDLGYLRGVVDHWANRYDWTLQQKRLNAFRHERVTVDVDDETVAVHVVPEPSADPRALPC